MSIKSDVDIDELLDSARLRPIHIRTLALCTIVMVIDGYDIYLVGWILPALSDFFHVSRVALTPLLLLQQIGMLLGGYLVAPLADSIGRRKLLLICLVGIGLACLGATTSVNPTQFMLWRIVTGLFAAAIVPNLLTLSSEVAPRRLRATFVTITICGAMGGALIGAVMQAFILQPYGWQGALFLGSALPLAIMGVALPWLPESPRFIVRRNPADPRIPRLIAALDPSLAGMDGLRVISRRETAKSGLRQGISLLLGPGQRSATLLLWCAFISSFAFISQWGSWSTTIFKDVLHMDWKDVALTMTVYTTAGVVGTLSVGVAIDRFGFRAVLPGVFLLGFLGAIAIGATASSHSMWVFLGIMSVFQVAGQAGLAALAPSLYPPDRKATGVGWAYGAGRIGSIIGPAIGSALLQLKVGALETFIGFGLPLLSAAVFLLFVLKWRERPSAMALSGT
jgi:MFS transporter, AAHS family, 4-hydroxybenzoate transporter